MTGGTLLFCIFLSSSFVDTTKLLPSRDILQKFVDLVEAHNLNVSIVTSHLQYWSSEGQKELKDSALQLPPNTVRLTSSQLTPEIGKEWVSFSNVTNKGAATYQIVNFRHGKFDQKVVESTNKLEIPVSPSYEKITLNIKPERFLREKPNYISSYTYRVYGPKGLEKTVQTISARINITLIEKSETMPYSEVKIIKNVLQKYYIPLARTTFTATCVDALDKLIPNSNWQIIMTAENYYIDAFKYAEFAIAETNLIIFSGY